MVIMAMEIARRPTRSNCSNHHNEDCHYYHDDGDWSCNGDDTDETHPQQQLQPSQ